MSTNEARMPILEHLADFRKRIVRASIFILLFSLIGWFFYNPIVDQLTLPICDLAESRRLGTNQCDNLFVGGVLGPLNLKIKVALIAGIVLATPFWLYQFWAFLAPGLHKKEKRYAIGFISFATPFFLSGVALGFFILPLAVEVLLGFTPSSLENLVRFDEYLDFVLRLILIFGIAFELPIILVSLNLVGALSGRRMLKPWRIAVFGIFFFTAALTPTGDPITMSALAVPLTLLYFGAGGVSILLDRRKGKKTSQTSVDEVTPIERPLPINNDE
ncbi:MAG: twin-arginine translocase subunit TatC [Actinobacteria bacterium]|nr:twin-arginine translocase subunit TatC [Actinomycetota bacterium]